MPRATQMSKANPLTNPLVLMAGLSVFVLIYWIMSAEPPVADNPDQTTRTETTTAPLGSVLDLMSNKPAAAQRAESSVSLTPWDAPATPVAENVDQNRESDTDTQSNAENEFRPVALPGSGPDGQVEPAASSATAQDNVAEKNVNSEAIEATIKMLDAMPTESTAPTDPAADRIQARATAETTPATTERAPTQPPMAAATADAQSKPTTKTWTDEEIARHKALAEQDPGKFFWGDLDDLSAEASAPVPSIPPTNTTWRSAQPGWRHPPQPQFGVPPAMRGW